MTEYCEKHPSGFKVTHCIHRTGVGTSHGWGGTDEYVCCHCGEKEDRRWTLVGHQLPDHGEFYKEQRKEYKRG